MGVSLGNYKTWLLRGVESMTAKFKRLFISDDLSDLSEHLRKLYIDRRETMFQASPSLEESFLLVIKSETTAPRDESEPISGYF
jgi:dynactin complex subunit